MVTHCYSSSTLLRKRLEAKKILNVRDKRTMVSMFEKLPFFKLSVLGTRKPSYLSSTSCRAMILATNVRPRSIRTRVPLESSLLLIVLFLISTQLPKSLSGFWQIDCLIVKNVALPAKKVSLQQLVQPIDSKLPPWSRLIGMVGSFDSTVYS